MNSYLKISDSDNGDKIPELRPILLIFWSKKNDHPKYSHKGTLTKCLDETNQMLPEKNSSNGTSSRKFAKTAPIKHFRPIEWHD